MSIRTAAQAVFAALVTTRNTPGSCQKTTRGYYDVPSAGDRDGDGDADAVDGWVSEPTAARHSDRMPKVGAPVAWSGGSKGFGHRAIVVGYADGTPLIRSTDAPSSGVTSTVPLAWVEQHWGLHYLGWSDTITGIPIEFIDPVTSKPVKAKHKNTKVARAHRLTERALIRLEAAGRGKTARAKALRKALKHLPEF